MSEQHTSVRKEVRVSKKRFVDVPVQPLDMSIIDREFGSSRDRFDQEMQKMELEMNRFRTDAFPDRMSLMGSDFPSMGGSDSNVKSSFKSERTVTSSRNVTSSSGAGPRDTGMGARDTGLDMMKFDSGFGKFGNMLESPDDAWKDFFSKNPSSPLITEGEGDNKNLRLRFDVHDYQPEDIEVKSVDSKLCVHAKHEEKGEGHEVYREFSKEFSLPENVDPELLRSSLSKDGILTVQAPLCLPTTETKSIEGK